uniref:Uncharacterized protein n=1 Tax=Rhizophora mucronata TaxID=61149 RepID=A0A2P2PRL5_RHIMU
MPMRLSKLHQIKDLLRRGNNFFPQSSNIYSTLHTFMNLQLPVLRSQ